MRKYFIIKLFLFAYPFVFLNLTSGQTLTVAGNFPDSVLPGQSFEVPFTIEKGSVSSFAKFQVDVPSGFYANPVDIHNGNWTFEQSRAKIVWVSVPSEPSFNVKINFKAPATASSIAQFSVKFFYLENNIKKELDVNPYSVVISSASANAATSTTETSSSVTTVTTTNTETVTAIENENVNTSTAGDTQTSKATQPTNDSKAASNTNVVFRIQIGAFSTKPPQSKFSGLKDIWMYEENGLTKVTTGKFSTLKEAEDFKSVLKSKGTDGFVVEFDNGVHVKIH
jgi:hypothetical protein